VKAVSFRLHPFFFILLYFYDFRAFEKYRGISKETLAVLLSLYFVTVRLPPTSARVSEYLTDTQREKKESERGICVIHSPGLAEGDGGLESITTMRPKA
jgi:hypothetical protein